jgi:endogenous inhibitor of DNA gyrase (YacG/DUF329 family)
MNRIARAEDGPSSNSTIGPPLLREDSIPRKTEVKCPQCGARNEVVPEALSVFCRECNAIISLKKEAPAVRSLDSKTSVAKTQSVTCYTCSNLQSVPIGAMSAFCSSCGNRIDLKDWEVKTDYHDKIMTRGRLHVLNTGKVYAEINVMSARIDGEIHGNVFAEDKVIIGSGGRVYGNVIARRMELEKGAFYSGNITLNADTIRK